MLLNVGWGKLENELRRLASAAKTIRYVPNPGNAGDALIGAGSWQLFDDLGLRPIVSRTRQIGPGELAIYGGGGNLVPEYSDCQRFLERCDEVGATGLVLAQSVRGHTSLLGGLDERFTIVCRDHASFAEAQRAVSRARVIFAPDLALRVDVERLFERCASATANARLALTLLARRKLNAYLRWRSALAALPVNAESTIHVIRTDIEASAGHEGQSQWDISHLYLSDLRSREESDFVARDLLTFVGRAKRIVTNRLHAGIAAALVGREVTYLDNSYGKIRAVYEAWLRDIPGITFSSSTASTPIPNSASVPLVTANVS